MVQLLLFRIPFTIAKSFRASFSTSSSVTVKATRVVFDLLTTGEVMGALVTMVWATYFLDFFRCPQRRGFFEFGLPMLGETFRYGRYLWCEKGSWVRTGS